MTDFGDGYVVRAVVFKIMDSDASSDRGLRYKGEIVPKTGGKEKDWRI